MTRNRMGRLSLCAASAAAALTAGASSNAFAQAGQIEEVIVTARKTEENLQSVPVAVTAIGAEALKAGAITDLSQIASRIPSFTYQQQNSMESEMFIRGVGSVRLNGATADPSIGTFLDEVYIGRRGSATPPIFDLARVEVLRGPQGTLFGKNIVGGAISLITAKPEHVVGGSGSISYGNYNAITTQAHITGPLSDTAAIRIALYQNSHDGYAKNIVTGQDLEDLESYAGRISVSWDPSETFRVLVTADISSDEGGGPSRHAVDDPTRAGFGFITPNLRSQDPRTNESPYPQYARRNTRGLTARADWDLGDYTLTYVSAVREGEGRNRWTQAGAGSPPSITDSTLTQAEDYRGITQELRLASPRASRLRWLAGLYYLNEETDRSSRNTAKSYLPGGAGSTRDSLDGDNIFIGNGQSKNYAVFGEANFDITEDLTFTVGGRYTKDEKSFTSRAEIISLGPVGLPNTLSPSPLLAPYSIGVGKDWSEFTPKFSLDWKMSPGKLLYASASKGFKGGGWQGAAANAAGAAKPYEPETAWNYEGGLKTDWFDRRLRVNIAAFYTSFKDLQVELLDDVNLTLVIANAANAKIKGVEVETQAQLTRSFSIFASGSLLDAKYDDYIDPLRGINYGGNKIQRTPDYQFNVGADWRHEVASDYELAAHIEYSYQDDIFWGPEETNMEDGYGQLDARISFGRQDRGWNVAVFGKNLTDKLYRSSIIPFVGDEVSLFGPPRTYGVRLSGRF
ncbi:TonB-dependent receptor [Caulobacter sp. NIBR2454]|uniref:TonB-dependent receptor n=1 Tax=Caulobacter sp. NIBR2454 TaxID=3015996 RepID=UPI0022B6D13E|nr:TonB-dependent receptor [Caulobacter sp. NIBR2454]